MTFLVRRSGAACRIVSSLLLFGSATTLVVADEAQDQPPFTVTGIRVEGLQRITEGAVFNTLPVNVGDTLDARRVREALRAV